MIGLELAVPGAVAVETSNAVAHVGGGRNIGLTLPAGMAGEARTRVRKAVDIFGRRIVNVLGRRSVTTDTGTVEDCTIDPGHGASVRAGGEDRGDVVVADRAGFHGHRFLRRRRRRQEENRDHSEEAEARHSNLQLTASP
jgi:hypothetical protein